MSRRLFVSLATAVAALLLVPAALAVSVHVRVEGKTRTIFGPTEPSLVSGPNALDALDAASLAGEFYYHVTTTAFGPYVDQIGRYPAAGSSGWVFKVNGVSPPVGADAVAAEGRRPRALVLRRPSGRAAGRRRSCSSAERNGTATACSRRTTTARRPLARGATLHVGSRRVRATNRLGLRRRAQGARHGDARRRRPLERAQVRRAALLALLAVARGRLRLGAGRGRRRSG